MVTICPYTFEIDYGEPSRPFSYWDYAAQAEKFALYNKRRHDAWLRHTSGLDNDYFPALSVNMGYGVHSAYFSGQEVVIGDETSWTQPCINDWRDIGKLKMDENNFWYKKVLEIAGYYVDWQDGGYAVSGFSNAGPGDMSNALRGNAVFYDIYDEPEQVHRLMDRCADAVIWLEKSLHALTGDVNGGSVTANCWFPGRVPYLSADFNDLCPAWVFETWDYKYMQKIIDAFDGAFVHHHAKGVHIHGSIARLNKLRLLEISWDPNMPRPVDMLPEIYELNGGVPLMIRCHARDVYKHIDGLLASRTVLMLNIDNLDEGREVMRFIRKHSKI
jgi:hypothetical protein